MLGWRTGERIEQGWGLIVRPHVSGLGWRYRPMSPRTIGRHGRRPGLALSLHDRCLSRAHRKPPAPASPSTGRTLAPAPLSHCPRWRIESRPSPPRRMAGAARILISPDTAYAPRASMRMFASTSAAKPLITLNVWRGRPHRWLGSALAGRENMVPAAIQQRQPAQTYVPYIACAPPRLHNWLDTMPRKDVIPMEDG